MIPSTPEPPPVLTLARLRALLGPAVFVPGVGTVAVGEMTDAELMALGSGADDE